MARHEDVIELFRQLVGRVARGGTQFDEVERFHKELMRRLSGGLGASPPDLAQLLKRAAALIHDEWDGTSADSDGNRWLRDYDALSGGVSSSPSEERCECGRKKSPGMCPVCDRDIERD